MPSSEAQDPGPFYHGTKADLKPGDLLAPGHSSNFGERKRANYIYLTATLDAATWGSGTRGGRGAGRIYREVPTGPFENVRNLTDKKFPGNTTRLTAPGPPAGGRRDRGLAATLPRGCFRTCGTTLRNSSVLASKQSTELRRRRQLRRISTRVSIGIDQHLEKIGKRIGSPAGINRHVERGCPSLRNPCPSAPGPWATPDPAIAPHDKTSSELADAWPPPQRGARRQPRSSPRITSADNQLPLGCLELPWAAGRSYGRSQLIGAPPQQMIFFGRPINLFDGDSR
nr:NAD(+)--rifampin ADP-ribosyltransferase [Arthrobacter sp. SO3]